MRLIKLSTTLLLALVPIKAFSLSKAVWSPIMDQEAIRWFEDCKNSYDCATLKKEDPWQSPDFNQGQTTQNRLDNIKYAVQAAYKKGIRSVDIYFYTSLATQKHPIGETSGELSQRSSFTQAGVLWIQAVNDLNNSSTVIGSNGVADYMKLRIRVNAVYETFRYVLYPTNPTKYASFKTAPPMARVGPSGTDPNIMDLSNAFVRQSIKDLTTLVLDGVFSTVNSKTAVEEVSLVLDNAGESSVYPVQIPPGTTDINPYRISFSNSIYNFSTTPMGNLGHFQSKQAVLKTIYTDFASLVRGYTYLGAAKNLKSALFFQGWAFDGNLRGGFDMGSFLKGTGINYIHHTQYPLWANESAEVVNFTSSMSAFLAKPFDTEFTWTSVGVPGSAGTACPFCWDNAWRLDVNADRSYFQGVSGMQTGGTGIVYANWTTRDITTPPNTASWNNLIGLPPPSSNWNSDHLYRIGSPGIARGMLAYSPMPAAKKAIYVSTLGRIDCEERRTCNAGTFEAWFDQFGVNAMSERVDIITDQMIKDAVSVGTLLGKYTTVFFPYETGGETDATVYTKLTNALPAGGDGNVWYQGSPGSSLRSSYVYWFQRTNHTRASF